MTALQIVLFVGIAWLGVAVAALAVGAAARQADDAADQLTGGLTVPQPGSASRPAGSRSLKRPKIRVDAA